MTIIQGPIIFYAWENVDIALGILIGQISFAILILFFLPRNDIKNTDATIDVINLDTQTQNDEQILMLGPEIDEEIDEEIELRLAEATQKKIIKIL